MMGYLDDSGKRYIEHPENMAALRAAAPGLEWSYDPESRAALAKIGESIDLEVWILQHIGEDGVESEAYALLHFWCMYSPLARTGLRCHQKGKTFREVMDALMVQVDEGVKLMCEARDALSSALKVSATDQVNTTTQEKE